MNMKFPQTLYINWEGRKNEQYLDTATSIEFIDINVDEVAIYVLKEVKKLKVTRELK